MTALTFANEVPLTFPFQRGEREPPPPSLRITLLTVLLIISNPCVHSFSFLIGMRVARTRHLNFIKLPEMDLILRVSAQPDCDIFAQARVRSEAVIVRRVCVRWEGGRRIQRNDQLLKSHNVTSNAATATRQRWKSIISQFPCNRAHLCKVCIRQRAWDATGFELRCS